MFGSGLRRELARTKTRLIVNEFALRALLDHLVEKNVLDGGDLASIQSSTRDLLEKAADDAQRRRREGRGRSADAFLEGVVSAAFLEMADRAD